MATSLDEKLFGGSPDTYVAGWDKDGQLVYLRTYFYDREKDGAQADLKKIIDAGLEWRIGHITLIKFAEEKETNDD